MAKERRAYRRIYWPREPRELACIFTVHVRAKGSRDKPWIEQYIEETGDPEKFAQSLVDNFNATLRPGESEREVVYVIRRGRCAPQKHRWEKTNLVTIKRGKDFIDTFKCMRCGITGHKEGLFGSEPVRDSRYYDQKFARCDEAVKIMDKRKRGIFK